jgi:hypothetical protein
MMGAPAQQIRRHYIGGTMGSEKGDDLLCRDDLSGWPSPLYIRPLYSQAEKGFLLLFDPDEGVCVCVCTRTCRAVAPVMNEASPERPQGEE